MVGMVSSPGALLFAFTLWIPAVTLLPLSSELRDDQARISAVLDVPERRSVGQVVDSTGYGTGIGESVLSLQQQKGPDSPIESTSSYGLGISNRHQASRETDSGIYEPGDNEGTQFPAQGPETELDPRQSSEHLLKTLKPRYEMPGCPFAEAGNSTHQGRNVNSRRQATKEAALNAANGRIPKQKKDRCEESTFFFARSEPIKFLIITVIHILASIPTNGMLLYLAWELHPVTHKRLRRKRRDTIMQKTSEIQEAKAELDILKRKAETSAGESEKDVQVRVLEKNSAHDDDERSLNQKMVENQQTARYERSLKERVSSLKGDVDRLYRPRTGRIQIVWDNMPPRWQWSHTCLFIIVVLLTCILTACSWYSIILVPFEIHYMHYCGKPGILTPVAGAMLWASYILIVLSLAAVAQIQTVRTWFAIVRAMRARDAAASASNVEPGSVSVSDVPLGHISQARRPRAPRRNNQTGGMPTGYHGSCHERQYAESAPTALPHDEQRQDPPSYQEISRPAGPDATGPSQRSEQASERYEDNGELRASVARLIYEHCMAQQRSQAANATPCNSRNSEAAQRYYAPALQPSISDSRSRLPSPASRARPPSDPDRPRGRRRWYDTTRGWMLYDYGRRRWYRQARPA